jgi:hypothetical protein
MFLNIHFGGALSGIDSSLFSQSTLPSFGATRLASSPDTLPPQPARSEPASPANSCLTLL